MIHRNKKRRKIVQWFFIIVIGMLLMSALLALGSIEVIRDRAEYFEACFALVSLLGAGVGLLIQMYDSRKLQEAEFLMTLNQSFVENADYAFVYTQLEREAGIAPGEPEPISRIQMSNYLTFFESMYLLVNENAIQMKMLNDLFGYRFFLAVHSDIMQDQKLCGQPANFKNIYYLEKIWMDYRAENHLKTFRYENRLEVACRKRGKKAEYDMMMSEMQQRYTRRKVRELKEKNYNFYTFRRCTEKDLKAVLTLQKRIIKEYPDRSFYQSFGEREIRSCMDEKNGAVYGVFFRRRLLAACLMDVQEKTCRDFREKIRKATGKSLELSDEKMAIAQFVMVDKNFRGLDLLQAIMSVAERDMRNRFAVTKIALTISPGNIYAIRNIQHDLHYELLAGDVLINTWKRNIYVKDIEKQVAFCQNRVPDKLHTNNPGTEDILTCLDSDMDTYFMGDGSLISTGDLLEYTVGEQKKLGCLEKSGDALYCWVLNPDMGGFVKKKLDCMDGDKVSFAGSKEKLKARIWLDGKNRSIEFEEQ